MTQRGMTPQPPPTIVVGYIPNELGAAAVRTAIAEARLRGGFVHVVNASRGESYVDRHLADADELNELDRLLSDSGVPHQVVQRVGLAEPAAEILDAARETSAVLVVIGLRHRTPVGKLLLGSTAQRILLDAPCPVLAVKA
ncbi:MAG TPA: universal stress protein [Nocardioidaceae bacterium]|nr:universal stress protein [Nocardioidaceae bacterium]